MGPARVESAAVEVNDLHCYPAAARRALTTGEVLVAGTIGRGPGPCFLMHGG